jgi:hypothetical protein
MQSSRKIPVWRDVADYGDYEVSDTGLIRNKKTNQILKPWINKKDGREHIDLYRGGGNKRHMRVHRLVCDAFHDNPDNKPCVDHIDGDILNNHAENLRWATHSENGMNRIKLKDNTSGFKGVSFNKRRGKWQAQIRKDGKRHHLGYFTNAEDAAKVYDKAATAMFGEFAKLNFPIFAAPQAKIVINITRKLLPVQIELNVVD